MSDDKIDVLAVMFADQFDAIPKRHAFADGKHLAALNAKSEAARAAIAELIDAGEEFASCDSLDTQKRLKAALARVGATK